MPSFETIVFRGQPAVRLALPAGDTCTVAVHGAHVLSWTTADGVERLYLSPEALFDGRSAIRGGVPICWPQFNQRGSLPKHGFVRNVPWRVAPADAQSVTSAADLVFVLEDDEATRAVWPEAFQARLTVTLAPGVLRLTLAVTNTGTTPWHFTGALHSYLAVDDIAQAQLEGLQGAQRWDAVRDERQVEAAPTLRFDTEFDSVYAAPAAPLRLLQPRGAIEIAQSASCTETVVWNPGAALSAKLADMPDDGYRHMLCVEAARIDEAVLLAPAAQWQGWQQLTVL
ncbi:D-hexose-6-phosphate mutarotase [Variovorax ginsengisoli]|uniref:Putative glucose-6-phosphate 1-epimerase n=1 Tax=Variovorax ginsengisoli TaxID=363844 RepID=A0ABT9S2G8_9BURK|nr:D-hexose-6-phosphate mutarotase [Variovorax ginsengisoli]MDP9898544.1 glucose-6-phosphate 1-epimerase [Variovorax ginsengisoli]